MMISSLPKSELFSRRRPRIEKSITALRTFHPFFAGTHSRPEICLSPALTCRDSGSPSVRNAFSPRRRALLVRQGRSYDTGFRWSALYQQRVEDLRRITNVSVRRLFLLRQQFPTPYADLRLGVSCPARDVIHIHAAFAHIVEYAESWRLYPLVWDWLRGWPLPVFSRFLSTAAAAADPRYSVIEDPQRGHGDGGSERPGGRTLHHDRAHHGAALLLLPNGGVGVETARQE